MSPVVTTICGSGATVALYVANVVVASSSLAYRTNAAVAKWLRRHSDKMVCDCPNQSCRTYAYVIQRSKIVDSQSIALGSNPSIGTLRL